MSLIRLNSKVPMYIEFTSPTVRFTIIGKLLPPHSCGIWEQPDGATVDECFALQRRANVFYASNFSLGVNIFFRRESPPGNHHELVSRLRCADGRNTTFYKLDAPSGIGFAGAENCPYRPKDRWRSMRRLNELEIKAFREDEVPRPIPSFTSRKPLADPYHARCQVAKFCAGR